MKNNFLEEIQKSIPAAGIFKTMKASELLSLGIIIFALYLGAASAFILGVTISLPRSVAAMMNQTTFLHLTAQFTFILILAFSFFRVMNLFVVGLIIFRNQIIRKSLLFKYRKNVRSKVAVYRHERRLNLRVAEGKSFTKLSLSLKTFLTSTICFILFFKTESEPLIYIDIFAAGLLPFLFLPFIAIFGTLSAHRVMEKKSFTQFFGSHSGVKLAISVSLTFFLVLGVIRLIGSMYGPTVFFKASAGFCRLSPIMPVFGGSLYFNQESENFVVIDNGEIIFAIPRFGSSSDPCTLAQSLNLP